MWDDAFSPPPTLTAEPQDLRSGEGRCPHAVLDQLQCRGRALLPNQCQARRDLGFKPARIHNHRVAVEDRRVVAYERMVADPEDDRLVLAVSKRGHADDGAL